MQEVRALSKTILEVGRTGLAEVWGQGRNRECCWDCFKLLAAEETTFSDGLQRETEMLTGPGPGVEIDIAGPKKYPLRHRNLGAHSMARIANSKKPQDQRIQIREAGWTSGGGQEMWALQRSGKCRPLLKRTVSTQH